MRGVNKAIIVGTLGKDPEMRLTTGGASIAHVSVATNEQWNDKHSGEKIERTEWHRLVIFGKLAEIAGQYLKKGSQVYFEGRLQTRKWQGQDGQDRYTTEIVVNEMQMLGSSGGSNSGGSRDQERGSGATVPQPASTQIADDYVDDIPFYE